MRTAKRSFRMFASIALVVMALVVTTVSMSEAWGYGWYGGGRYWGGGYWGWPSVYVGFGAPYAYPWWRPYYSPYYAYPYPSYYPYPAPVVQEDTVYVQRPPAPPAPAAPPAPEAYWHYCESEKGYYPTVPTCPEAWIKVPPRAQ